MQESRWNCTDKDSNRAPDRRLMQKHRTPFPSRPAIVRRAVAQFDFTAEIFDEAGGAEDGQGFALIPGEPSDSI